MKIRIACVSLALLALAGCSQGEEPAEAPVATVHEFMTETIDPVADEVWAVGNAAIGEKAGIDPALMGEAKWTRLADAAGRLSTGAARMAALDPPQVTHDGVKIADEDIEFGHSAADVQGFIDADPQGFRDMAGTLQAHAADLRQAALQHDAERAGVLVDGLDPVCESCHLEFWYPSQKELLRQLETDDPVLQEELRHVIS